MVKALMAKPSPLSPPQPQLLPSPSRKESGEVRAGSFATSSSSGTLGDTHPFTTKKGSSMDMASRPLAASLPLHAQGARALRSSLRPPDWPPAAAGASAWGTQSSRRAQSGVLQTAAGPALGGIADRIPDSGAGPHRCLLPQLRPAGPAGLTPPPRPHGLGQPRTQPAAPLPHPRSRDRACPASSWAGPRQALFDPGGGALGAMEKGRSSSQPAPQNSGGGAVFSLLGRQVGFQDVR